MKLLYSIRINSNIDVTLYRMMIIYHIKWNKSISIESQ